LSYVPTKVCDDYWYWRPEPAYADADNNGTKDETNAATGIYFTFPVFIGIENPVYIRKLKQFTKYQSGSRYHSKIQHDGYKEVMLTITGPVIDHSLLYFLTDACITADNTPGAGQYTHTYVNTATHVNPPKSFEIYHRSVNDKSGGGESVLELITGCTVVSYSEKADTKSKTCTGTYTIKGRNIVTATALTTPGYPTYPTLNFLTFDNAVLTWTKGGAATNGYMVGYEYNFITDRDLIKEGGSYYPVATKSPNKVEVSLKVSWIPTETDSYDDSQDDPLSALNKDITLKISRNTTTDYFQIAIVDGFQELLETPAWVENILQEDHLFWLNPHEATPSTITLTEVNALDDDRYET
jgi:hypothetical protein